MPRSRLIRPSFFKHGELFDAEQATGLPLRVAFAGLWTVADKEGRFRWKPRDIKPDVLPNDAVDFADVMNALEMYGFIRRYVVGGKEYGYVPSWEGQQPVHHTEQPSKLPAPLDNGSTTVGQRDNAVTDTVTVTSTDKLRDSGDSTREFANALTAAANAAARQKWNAEPWMPGTVPSFTTAQELIEAGIPLPLAAERLVTQIEASTHPKPPRTLRYFLPGCLESRQAPPRRPRTNPGAQQVANIMGGKS